MKKLCWLLILVLVIGCFAGCQQAPKGPIENEDGTLADWMKEEIDQAHQKRINVQYEENGWSEEYTGTLSWYEPKNASYGNVLYLGTYGGYVMFVYEELPMNAWYEKEIAGFTFAFPTIRELQAYKEGQFYVLEDLYMQGVLNNEAIELAHNHYVSVFSSAAWFAERFPSEQNGSN